MSHAPRPWIPAILALSSPAVPAAAQDGLLIWGANRADSRAFALPAVDLTANEFAIAVLRSDGRVFVQGQTALPNAPLPPNGSYAQVAFTIGYPGPYGFGLLSTGDIASWGPGGAGLPAPTLPIGVTYVRVVAGVDHAVALRSDGVAVAWGNNAYGKTLLTALPPGVTVLDIGAGATCSFRLLSNGTIVGNGQARFTLVPPLPTGTTYTRLWTGPYTVFAGRSDGRLVAWGNNGSGQCNAPPIPPRTTWAALAPGATHTLGMRSDGVVMAWGDNGWGQCDVPSHPAQPVAQLAAGRGFSVLRAASGAVATYGRNDFVGALPVPAPGTHWAAIAAAAGGGYLLSSAQTLQGITGAELPPPPLPTGSGLTYTAISPGWGHQVALRSDGHAVAWGYNYHGECNIPPLPPGMTYDVARAGGTFTALVRSDGLLVTCGQTGSMSIPQPQPGTHFVDLAVDVSPSALLALASDGTVPGAPALPPGLRYTGIAAASSLPALLRCDGQIDFGLQPWVPPPPLPIGVYYVQIVGNSEHVLARRSDGEVVLAAYLHANGLDAIPQLDPGESCVDVASSWALALARTGPASTYVGFASGCAGTRAVSRLVPQDTPAIGRHLEVDVFDLPENAAVMAFGWHRAGPTPLAPYGMPGCALAITLDAAVLLFGHDGVARYWLTIPNHAGLVGLSFANQALVFDAAANAAGAVVSDAGEGVIGHH